MKKSATTKGESPSRLIDARIKELDDWRGKTLSHVRALIKQADPEVVEEWKWRGVPVWSHDGLICTGETYKSVVKLTFAKGASLKDPSGLFNSSLEGNVRRAIDLHEGDEIYEDAFKTLIRAAATLNRSSARESNPAPHEEAPILAGAISAAAAFVPLSLKRSCYFGMPEAYRAAPRTIPFRWLPSRAAKAVGKNNLPRISLRTGHRPITVEIVCICSTWLEIDRV